ncbi:hypothetical protein GCM10027168_57000 [Streptomyces capparidis]
MNESARRASLNRRALLAAATAAAGAAALPAVPAHASPANGAEAGGWGGAGRGNRYALQRAFTDRRFGMFLHFNMGTFHDAEWVDPDRDPMTFAPAALDCGQWADAAKAAGMTFGVLTAKHHDGFCLWPSKYTDYDVMSSACRRDVVREYVTAFRSRGLAACLYFSLWDRTQRVEAPVGRDDMEFVKGQLTELLTGYGPIPLLIFDGWAWQMGHREAPWGEIRAHVASLQPDCLVLDLNGLTVPWESDLLFMEETKGGVFCPPGNTYAATQGQTILPTGWFWHPNSPQTPTLTPEEIVDGHLKVLEPRYCTFILNCPPNDKGLLDPHVVDTLREVGRRWRPDPARPPLPPQPDQLRYPLTPVSATATSGDAAAAVDGISDFGWNGQATQTLWRSDAALPQAVTLDLGRVRRGVDTFTYLPRQDTAEPYSFETFVTEGNVTGYRVSVSVDGTRFRTVARGRWAGDHTLKQVSFRPQAARYVRFEALATVGSGPAVASEIGCGGRDVRPS